MEQARFSDRLRPELDIDPASLDAAIPTFALQHLVENAIRHGIARRDGELVEVTAEDDGVGIDGEAPADGRGLENTRERLRTLYGDRASLTVTRQEQGTIARFRVPFRHVDRPDRGR